MDHARAVLHLSLSGVKLEQSLTHHFYEATRFRGITDLEAPVRLMLKGLFVIHLNIVEASTPTSQGTLDPPTQSEKGYSTMPNVFAPQVFFIAFRECLEASVVISFFAFLSKAESGSA